MSDNPLDRIPSFDRVSIRAVVVYDDEDAGQALSEAGIVDPIALPMVFGEGQPGNGLGDGITPNLTVVLEFDQQDDEFQSSARPADGQRGPTQLGPVEAGLAPQTQPATASLPAAYGAQALAPIRPRSG